MTALRQQPDGKAGHHRNGLGDAIDREQRARASVLSSSERSSKYLVSLRDDPEIGRRVIDDRRQHPAEAEVEAELHHHQHDRKDNADERRDEAKPVVKQVSRRECVDKRHVSIARWHSSEIGYVIGAPGHVRLMWINDFVESEYLLGQSRRDPALRFLESIR